MALSQTSPGDWGSILEELGRFTVQGWKIGILGMDERKSVCGSDRGLRMRGLTIQLHRVRGDAECGLMHLLGGRGHSEQPVGNGTWCCRGLIV